MTSSNKSETFVGKHGAYASIPLDNLPKHAQALGRLLGHWALLEDRLMATLGLALKLDHSRATVIWQEFVSTRGKITLLQRLNSSMGTNELKEELGENTYSRPEPE